MSGVRGRVRRTNIVEFDRPDKPNGVLDPLKIGQSLGHYFPDNAIVVDEGGMSGAGATISTRTAAPHDWLMLTGGRSGMVCLPRRAQR